MPRKYQNSKSDAGKKCEQCGKLFVKRNKSRTQESRFCGYSCSIKSRLDLVIATANTPEANAKKGLKMEKHPRWIPDRKTKFRPSYERNKFRREVLERDEYKCIWCGSTENLVADHIKPYATHPELLGDLDNGRTLCDPCHKKTDTYGLNVKSYRLIPLKNKIKEAYETGMYSYKDIARYHRVAESVIYRIITGKILHATKESSAIQEA